MCLSDEEGACDNNDVGEHDADWFCRFGITLMLLVVGLLLVMMHVLIRSVNWREDTQIAVQEPNGLDLNLKFAYMSDFTDFSSWWESNAHRAQSLFTPDKILNTSFDKTLLQSRVNWQHCLQSILKLFPNLASVHKVLSKLYNHQYSLL